MEERAAPAANCCTPGRVLGQNGEVVDEHTSSGGLLQLTALPDPASAASYVAGRRQAVLQVDAICDDEGHGLSRLENRIDAYTRAVSFLDGAMAPPHP